MTAVVKLILLRHVSTTISHHPINLESLIRASTQHSIRIKAKPTEAVVELNRLTMPLANIETGQAQHSTENDVDPTLPSELTLLTLNCWGLLHISALRTPRLAEIGRHIAALEPTPHIVCLQECWVQDDYRAIRDATRAILPHGKFYHSGAFGGGLAILSRWPIEESSMFPYKLNGRPTAFWRGDWYVGKGVATAKVRYGPGRKDIIEVFNTHVSGKIQT